MQARIRHIMSHIAVDLSRHSRNDAHFSLTCAKAGLKDNGLQTILEIL